MKYRQTVLLNVILPVVLGISLLYYYKGMVRKAEDIGLGESTSSYFPYSGEYPIHIKVPEFFSLLQKGWKERGSKDVLLWLGNSQLHGINHYQQGSSNAVEFLYNCLKPSNTEVVAASYPNANMQELLVSVLYYSDSLKFKGIILPFFYDDMREEGIRDVIHTNPVVKLIKKDSSYFRGIESIEKLELKDTAAKAATEPGGDYNGIKETTQDVAERYLNKKLEDRWGIWSSRPDFRGSLFVDLYNLRNTVFGIKPGTVRKMINRNYDQNYKAFTALINYCTDKKIPLYVYIPPIRNDVVLPYDMNAYTSFKKTVEEDCKKNGVQFINLEGVVPGKYWGMKKSGNFMNASTEYDFMHFQETGHRLLADTICKVLMSNK